MALPTGAKLGPYEIVAPLGAGGMGEVYRARDTRLDRTVAIKILPAHLSSNPEARQRFDREARSISSVNHPHICTLFDVGHQDGTDFLVMEFLDGETLADRLSKGPLPREQVLRYGIEIGEGLDRAHKAGVVHRDLKPGNVMVTKSGVKLMDFGLAKLKSEIVPGVLTAVTSDEKLTTDGTIVGTFQYMAPEQLEGQEADARTDIFAFGEVLYEMATGKPAFSGKTRASLIAAILSSDPRPVTELAPATPPALDRVIKRCLAKDPEERWQTARDLVSELKWIAESGGHAGGTASSALPARSRERLAWVMATVLAVALMASFLWWRNSKPPEQAMNFYAPLPFPAHDVAMAPNGHTLALVAYKEAERRNVLWTYELGAAGATSLPDTEGARFPFWSADGQSIAFFADGRLKRLELSGGQVQTICDAPSGRGGTWNKDDVIIFTPFGTGTGLYRVPASGGTATQITHPDWSREEYSHRWPMFLPDGIHYLYMAANFSGKKGVNAIYVGALGSNEKRFVVEAATNAAYAAPGYLLFYRDKTLFAQRFDLRGLALAGEPTPVLTGVQYLDVGRAVFAVSDHGVLVAQTSIGATLSQPVWFDRTGKEMGTVGKPDVYGNVVLASNGRVVATSQTDPGSQNTDLWTYELQGGKAKRLTFDPGYDAVPIWSPDATRLLFASNRRIRISMYMKDSDGATEEKNILNDDIDEIPNDWSRDGKHVLYAVGANLWVLNLPELKGSQFLKATAAIRNSQFSPDGKWVAYASNESGKWEIYVTSFPEGRGRWQVSTGGGEQPRWRGDGKELFYLSLDGKMMAAPVISGTNFDSGTPVTLFQTAPREPVSVMDMFVYDASRDGQRFLVNTQVKQADTQPMTIILNWTAKLNK
jgi:Tol biopolymer transport system component/predicted Ser/Thr protein kinase